MRSQQGMAGMDCPTCRTPLAISVRADIEIDYCPSCRGVWLDRGELDKIIERSGMRDLAPAPPPRHDAYQTPYRDDREKYGYSNGYGKRKKSFLAELFD